MNKFLAMLKDSYREAVDGWILFIMLIFSGLVILLVASASFTPVEPEVALPRMVMGDDMRRVYADGGNSKRVGIFMYSVNMSDVVVGSKGAKPWETETRFTLYFVSTGFGPAGVEVDDAKQPKDAKQIEGGGLFSNSFQAAAMYWARKPGSLEKPKYTEELGKEFATHQLQNVAGLNVTSMEQISAGKYRVTTSGTKSRNNWVHKPSLFFGLVPMSFLSGPLGSLVYLIESTLVNGIGAWVILLTGVIVTAGFVPNLLRKGNIDLWLTKPISRVLILIYKYLGGLMFVFLLTSWTICGIWLAIGLRTGILNTGLLTCVFGVTFYVAILYACSTLFGVLSRNALVSIATTLVFWCALWVIGFGHNWIKRIDSLDIERGSQRVRAPANPDGKSKAKGEEKKDEENNAREPDVVESIIPSWVVNTAEILNRTTPRTNDLDTLTTLLIARGLVSEADTKQAERAADEVAWGEVVGVSCAWIGIFLGLALLRFTTRSY